ncbi:MAG: flagellar hook capping FlgD N-terminal domain-containing protein [Roseobacter sp.]|nr:flagellar hook capping FlgD N-terminal domain-containing protein [Roseobacter sp.]
MNAFSLAGPAADAQAAAAAGRPGANTGSSDYETFLRMLTTQLENQDPLNPSESDQLAVQLATFSGVEQQTLTNDLLADLNARIALDGLAQLGTWVGMEVLAQGPVGFSGAPIDLEVSVPTAADAADLVVFRSDGTEVQRVQIDPTRDTAVWSGISANGQSLPPGTYRLEIAARASGQAISGGQVAAYRSISEVRAEGPATVLIGSEGDRIAASDVEALRPGR